MLKLNECVRFAYSSYWANAFQIANCLFFERKRGFLVTFFTVIVSSWTSSFCRGRFLGQVLPRLETGLISYSSKNPKSTRFDSFRCPTSSPSSILFLHPDKDQKNGTNGSYFWIFLWELFFNIIIIIINFVHKSLLGKYQVFFYLFFYYYYHYSYVCNILFPYTPEYVRFWSCADVSYILI